MFASSRKIYFLLLLQLFSFSIVFAQAPQAIPYQAVARDVNGNVLGNQAISLRFSVHDLLPSGTIVYQETQSLSTNSLGLFTCNLGQGVIIVGTLSSVNWGSGEKYIQVEFDAAGGTNYTDMGTTQLMSVPYALYAGSSNGWTTTGNSGTNDVANALGTNDATDLVIKTDNFETARLFSNPETSSGINPPTDRLRLMRTGLVNQKWPMVASFQLGSYEANIEGRTQMDIALLNNSGVYADTKVMSLLANGHVGIGNTTPHAPLQLSNSLSNRKIVLYETSDNDHEFLGLGVNPGMLRYQVANSSDNHAFFAGNGASASNELMRITGTGNVGIGTQTPTTKLDIAGNIKIADGTQGAGKLLKSDANGVASWSHVTLPDLLNMPSTKDISCLSPIGSVGTGSGPTSIQLSGNYAFVANPANNIIQAFNISNPSDPIVGNFVLTDNYPIDLSVVNNYAYVVNFTSNTFQVINVSNPAAMTVVGSVATDLNPVSISVQGNYAYVANRNGNSMQVFDITNPLAPLLAGTLALSNAPQFIKIAGNYAYLLYQNSNVFQVIDISNPVLPAIVGTTTAGYWLQNMTISGNYAYVLNSAGTMEVIDISNSASPNNVASLATGSNPYAIYISGIYACVVCAGSNAMQVFDISNPIAPGLIGTLAEGLSFPQSVIVSENFAYICNDNNSLTVVQLFCNNELSIDPVTNEVITTSVLPENWSRSGNNINNINNGNVGIGTSSPTAKLDIAGNIKIADGTQGTGKVLTSDASGNATWQPNQSAGMASFLGDPPTVNNAFIGPTVSVVITSSTQKVMWNVSKALGSTAVGGADGLNIYAAYALSGSANLNTVGGGIFGLRCAQNTRQTVAISGVVTGLAPGTYVFGMAGGSSNPANWNNNEWGYVTYILME